MPKTPYRRVLESREVSEEEKAQLREEYARLNPVELKGRIEALQNRLFRMAAMKGQRTRGYNEVSCRFLGEATG